MSPQTSADGPKTGARVGFSARRRGSAADWDRGIARIAEGQYGLVSLEQLRGLGIADATVHKRAESGSLHRVHHGVYAVGYPGTDLNRRRMAAVLACGPNAVLSHRSAAALWGIRTDDCASIDVTAPNRRGRIPDGIDAHRDRCLASEDRAALNGIPCTSLVRTLLDLAAAIPVWELRKALSEAEVLRLLDHAGLRRLIGRSGGRRGVARLRMLLDEIHPDTKRTRSELERLFLRMCSRAGLPRPEVNVPLDVGNGSLVPDFLWRDAGLIVEADSRRFHDTHSAFQHDRQREQRLQLAGWRVSRSTWEQVERESQRLIETIRGLLTLPSLRRRA